MVLENVMSLLQDVPQASCGEVLDYLWGGLGCKYVCDCHVYIWDCEPRASCLKGCAYMKPYTNSTVECTLVSALESFCQ